MLNVFVAYLVICAQGTCNQMDPVPLMASGPSSAYLKINFLAHQIEKDNPESEVRFSFDIALAEQEEAYRRTLLSERRRLQ